MNQSTGFLDLNAQRLTRLERSPVPNINRRIYPSVVPDRSHVDDAPPAPPPPAPEPTEMAGKKKRKRSPEAIAKFKATLAAKKAAKFAGSDGEKEAPVFDGLDLILDILDLCEKAKKGLTRSQRVRLKAALSERL